MNTRTCFCLAVVVLAVLALLLLVGQSLQAAPSTAQEPVCLSSPIVASSLLAADDGWSFRHIFRSLNTRTGVVQFCVGAMCLALLILMKK